VSKPLPIRVLTQARFLIPGDRIVVMHTLPGPATRKTNHTHTTVRKVTESTRHQVRLETDAFPIPVHLPDLQWVEVTCAVRTLALHCTQCLTDTDQEISLDNLIGQQVADSGNAYVHVELRTEIKVDVVCTDCGSKTDTYRRWGE
jgi:hypothetical protein